MDSFWKSAKKAGPTGVSCLRQLLGSEKDGFFLFDGSSLLLSLDESEASLDAIKSALARVALVDIDIGGYMSLLIRFGQKNVEIGPLASRYLRHPDVTAAVPQHAMTLDRANGAILVYGSMSAADIDKHTIPFAERR